VDNPAEAIRPSAIATFKPRDRALTPAEIHVFFSALEQTTMPTLRLAREMPRPRTAWRARGVQQG
jgi:hypothetical protein